MLTRVDVSDVFRVLGEVSGARGVSVELGCRLCHLHYAGDRGTAATSFGGL